MEISENEAADYSAGPATGREPTSRVQFTVPDGFAGQRLDAALAGLLPEHSRSRLQEWIRAGRVMIDDVIAAEPKTRLAGGELLIVSPAVEPRLAPDRPEAIPLAIVFADDSLIVIDKPAGLVVHPGSGNWSGTLLNALLHYAPAVAELPRAGIVHRLDKDTSGLLVVARTLTAQTDLVRQLQARTVKREYLALVRGELTGSGEIDAPIGRHPTQRTRMAVVDSGKPARTRYRVIENFAGCTLLECALDTGRTHQIRVHLAWRGHPLVGDPVYGGGRGRALPAFPRQALHARRLGLLHPVDHRPLQWESPLPADLAGLLAGLRAGSPDHRHA